MNTKGAIRVGFGRVFRFELVSSKGFRIVLLRVGGNRGSVQANKRCVHNAQLIELLHLLRHDFLQVPVVHFFQEAVISPVRWQGFHDVKAAVMGNETVVIQVICQIGDLCETFAFHDDKSADHGFFGEATPLGRRPGQREVQISEQLVIKRGGALGCEQRYILNYFLSVDCGQPLSGWVFSQVYFTRRSLRFLQY